MFNMKISMFAMFGIFLASSENALAVPWAQQGWSAKERDSMHYRSAGQAIAPLAWLKALERADSRDMLLDPKHMKDLGFIFEPRSKLNPDRLPVGFAVAPPGSIVEGQVGLTCSACHTEQITYKGKTLKIDGGSSMADIVAFVSEYYTSLKSTYLQQDNWARFIKRLKPINEENVRSEIKAILDAKAWQNSAAKNAPGVYVEPGPGRMDPFNTIGNGVFGGSLLTAENYVLSDSPVNPPQLWDIWRLNWVHFNSSFTQPMSRNILQILGNGGKTNFLDGKGNTNPEPELWNTSVDFAAIQDIEAGLKKLKAPRWPSNLLGKYDRKKVIAGKVLYEELCSDCHAPRPISAPDNRMAELAVSTIPNSYMATDSAELASMKRLFNPKKLTGNSDKITTDQGLFLVTEGIKQRGYDLLGYTTKQRDEADGYRPNIVRASDGYKARPLDGVWATPPYLHNGSVINIFDLLSPVSERTANFYVGSTEYDPKNLGFLNKKTKSTFLFDTQLAGNTNSGHEFCDQDRPGVIGRALSNSEKYQIIEYLKALPDMPPKQLDSVDFYWEWTQSNPEKTSSP